MDVGHTFGACRAAYPNRIQFLSQSFFHVPRMQKTTRRSSILRSTTRNIAIFSFFRRPASKCTNFADNKINGPWGDEVYAEDVFVLVRSYAPRRLNVVLRFSGFRVLWIEFSVFSYVYLYTSTYTFRHYSLRVQQHRINIADKVVYHFATTA